MRTPPPALLWDTPPGEGQDAGLQSRPSRDGTVGAQYRWACEHHTAGHGSPSRVYGNWTYNRGEAVERGREHDRQEYAQREHELWRARQEEAQFPAARPGEATDAGEDLALTTAVLDEVERRAARIRSYRRAPLNGRPSTELAVREMREDGWTP